MARTTNSEEVLKDVKDLFLNDEHWIYQSPGTPSQISSNSIYHLKQIQVLFEDRYFHDRTYRALQELLAQGFLTSRDMTIDTISTTLLWRKANVRYPERAIKAHIKLMSEYSSQEMNKATGDYAELLVQMGLSRLELVLLSRNANSYKGKVWTETDHNLDFVMERSGVGYGIEVKNTFDYFPGDELSIKLKMCKFLGLVPLFIVRHRYSNQWHLVQKESGLLYIFKSKMFPLGQDALVRRIWEEMRLPVAIWKDWPGQFYTSIGEFIKKSSH